MARVYGQVRRHSSTARLRDRRGRSRPVGQARGARGLGAQAAAPALQGGRPRFIRRAPYRYARHAGEEEDCGRGARPRAAQAGHGAMPRRGGKSL